MQIRAAVTDGSGQSLVHELLELEEPGSNEVLVRVVSTGLCQTDAHVRHQRIPTPLPLVLGHEGAGVVEAVGSGVDCLAPGDHVVMSYQSYGRCRSCLQGLKVPDDAPLAILGPLGCGFQTGAGAVLNSFNVRAGQSLAVLGVGAVGFAAVMAAKASGAGVIVAVDVVPQRLALAVELGATHTINSRSADVASELRKLTGRGVDFVLDTTGRADMLTAAVAALAPLGEVGLVAGGQPDAQVAASALGLGLKVRGIVQGDAVPQLFIPQLIQMFRVGQFPFDRLIQPFAFDNIEAAFEAAASGEVIKPVIQIGSIN
jgi:aryl-alcohol dehydrogenase